MMRLEAFKNGNKNVIAWWKSPNSFFIILKPRLTFQLHLMMAPRWFRKLTTGKILKRDSTISCHHFDLRAIFTNNTDHYGLKWRQNHVRQFVGGGVLVIRNPYNAIISFWNFEQTGTHTVFAGRKSFCSLAFREFAFRSIFRWYELHEDWLGALGQGRNLHVVLYEERILRKDVWTVSMFDVCIAADFFHFAQPSPADASFSLSAVTYLSLSTDFLQFRYPL